MMKKYTKTLLALLFALLICLLLCGCARETLDMEDTLPSLKNGWQAERSMALEYAENFRVDYFAGDFALITLIDGSRFLVVPEGSVAPDGIDADITILQRPLQNLYLEATSAMCLFDALDAVERIRFSCTQAEDWSSQAAQAAMAAGNMLYAGSYNAPDYELVLANECPLAIYSVMIDYAPEVKEKLEDIGVPVMTDLSTYEPHPLGRTEWIKLYAALLGKEALAERYFSEQVADVKSVTAQEHTGKTVAFFYISSSGNAVTRKSGDYVSKMIELAGGENIFKNLGDEQTSASTVKLEMEKFYATAKDADFIFYNSTITGELASLEELLSKNPLMEDFKAVREGNVWCTAKNLYQETTQLGQMIQDIRSILTQSDEGPTELSFFYKLQ